MRPTLPLLLLLALGAVPAGRPDPSPATGETRTHVLYLGADFSVDWQGKACRVVDLEGESLVIDVDGVRTPLRAATAQLPIRMTPVLKSGRGSAEVLGLQGTSTFSHDNNPHRASEAGVALAQDASALADLALTNLRNTEMMAGATEVERVADPTMKASLGSAQEAYQDSLHTQGSTTHSAVGQAAGAGAGHDAFLLSFTVAAPHALRRPYAMVVVRYLDQPDNPKTARIRFYPLALARVDPKPRRYHLLRAGLPPGYQLERYAVHLYEDGREIATSVSAKRVELTTEEAFQYALVSHLADLRSATQAPIPAQDFWPADLAARLNDGNRNRLVYVQVDKHGRATGAFHDEAARLRISDADIESLLPELRFLPALDQGKAVPGVCQVSLGSLPL